MRIGPPENWVIRNLATGENHNATNEGSWNKNQFAYYSIWSPDGKQLAYFWMNGSHAELRVVAREGGEPRVLYVHPEKGSFGVRPMAWSPDGRMIAGRLSRADATNQIVLVATDKNELRVLKSTEWRYPGKMSFSPDSRWLAYDAQTEPPSAASSSPNRDLFLLAVDGSREIALVKHPANDFGPMFTPDGSQVLFVSNRSGANSLWAVPFGDPLRGVPVLLKADVGRMFPMGLTRDGKLFLGEASGQNAGDIYLVELDSATGGVVGSPTLAAQTFEGNNTSPAISPDGMRLAYLSRRVGWRLVIHSLETKKEQLLDTDLGSIESPRASTLRWSPDGRSLLTAGVDRKGKRGLFQVDMESGKGRLVAEHDFPVETHPCWSPDGETVYMLRLTADKMHKALVAHQLRTGAEQKLYETEWMTGLAISPDGTRLAFVQQEIDGEKKVMTLNEYSVADRAIRPLFRSKPAAINGYVSVTWAADGRSLFMSQRVLEPATEQIAGSEQMSLWRISATGREPVKLSLNMEGLRNLTVSRDGSRLAFTAGRPFRSEVWVLENFLPLQQAPR